MPPKRAAAKGKGKVKVKVADTVPAHPVRRSTRGRKQNAEEAVPAPELPAVTKPARGKKRKIDDIVLPVAEAVSQPVVLDSEPATKPQSKRSKTKPAEEYGERQEEEVRLKKFRPRCPQNIAQRKDRVRTQRMFCLGRERDEENLTEVFQVAGSTGNVYQVTLANIPSCDCPDSQKNGTCKHILFVMIKVLRVRDDLSYQAALLDSEIREIFATSQTKGASEDGEKRKRKPLDEEECPICYEDFNAADEANTVYCKAQCGSNMHRQCFMQWAASRGSAKVTCVMCRTEWQFDSADEGDYGDILKNARVGSEGYLNVAHAMGMPTYRDGSTYHRWGWRHW